MKILYKSKILGIITSGLIFTGVLVLLSRPQSMGFSQASENRLVSSDSVEPSNYCISCHSGEDLNPTDVSAWVGGIERTAINPCPASTRLQEELYYTERLLMAIEHGREYLGDDAKMGTLDRRIEGINEGYARLLDTPVVSLEAFTAESMSLRYQAGKIYSQIQQLVEANKRQRALVIGIIITGIIILSLTWGFTNAKKFEKTSKKPIRFSTTILWAVIILIIFGVFSLPLFRSVSQQTASANTEIQTALDASQRLAVAADRSHARAWMFGRIGAVQSELDEEKAEQILASAIEAAVDAERNTYALWGEAASTYEISVEDAVLLEKAGLIASQLNSVRSRSWSLALTAEEWAAADPSLSEKIYLQAVQAAKQGHGIYRDLDLRRIAVSWFHINPAGAVETVNIIQDPAVRSWGLREIAAQGNDPTLFDQAAQAARLLEDPILKARLLTKIASLNQNDSLWEEARAVLLQVPESETALALSDLAPIAGEVGLVSEISLDYPQARALAYLRLGYYQDAWGSAEQISDSFERARAQAAIAAEWAKADGDSAAAAAEQIQVRTLRERALRDVIQTTGDASLVEKLNIAYYRVQALTSIRQYQAAWEQAAALSEPYPLMKLGISWAETDPEAASRVLDVLKRESDKAPVLLALTAAAGDESLFERALGMALAARVRNDVLAPVRATLDLAETFLESKPEWAETALKQAVEITQRISIK